MCTPPVLTTHHVRELAAAWNVLSHLKRKEMGTGHRETSTYSMELHSTFSSKPG